MFCGIDWADDHHDIALVADDGSLLSSFRIGDDRPGLERLLDELATHGERPEDLVPVAIETPRGLLVRALRAAGRPVYAINPLAASRYRARRSVSQAKSDPADARLLADILRTDRDAHRPLPNDSDLLGGIAVLARAHQDAIGERRRITNRLRAHLREYFTAALRAFEGAKNPGLDSKAARTVLAAAPTPAAAANLDAEALTGLLAGAGRPPRRLEPEVQRLQAIFASSTPLRQPAQVEQAMGRQTAALVLLLDAICQAITDLAEGVEESFAQHSDAAIITSFPGLSTISGARVLAEIGDDRSRFASARALKAYAGSAPVTRASGRSRAVSARVVKNQRLAGTGYMWAFAALRTPGPREHYKQRRAGGERHTSALRHLFNRLLGCLYHCLQTRQLFDSTAAFSSA